MTDQELQQQRAHKWRLDGDRIQTLEQARAFVDDVGFCLMYPDRSLPLVPTFMGAFNGSAERLPDTRHAFADPRSQPATDLMVRLLRERTAYEMSLSPSTDVIISAAIFPFFYALVGDRNPKAPPKLRSQGARISPLTVNVFEKLQKHGPLSREKLRQLVGHEPSNAALDRALNELWAILKITRVDHREGEGAIWDVLFRWAPDAVKEGASISAPEAISALISKYLQTVVAAGQDEIEQLFSHLASRSKIRDAIHALLAARELSVIAIGTKTMVHLTPEPEVRRRVNG
jgi:23S rRNA pseudouridine2605 synthase